MFDTSLGYKKKRATVFWSFLVVALVGSGFLVWQVVNSDNLGSKDSEAGSVNPDSAITVVYEAHGGGKIDGERTQTITKGERTILVKAIPESGYYFSSWDDGNTNPERSDQAVVDTTYTAIFKQKN